MKLTDKDEFYEVLLEPTRDNFRFLLQNHLGEEDYLDFKEIWLEKEKMAKHILAISNSGGGCIVFGVKQNDDNTFKIKGLDELKDKKDLKDEIQKYIPDTLQYYLKDFVYDNSEYDKMKGKKFQLLIIEDIPKELPYVCCHDGKGLKDGDIYVRKGTSSDKANNYDIDKIINRKLVASKINKKNKLNLNQHLGQLDLLYSELTYVTRENGPLSGITSIVSKLYGTEKVNKKKCYPKEDYDDFIVRMIDKKKKRIEEELDV